MEISEHQFQAATIRGEEERRSGHAVNAAYDARRKRLVVDLNTGMVIMVPVHLLEDLADANTEDLAEIELSPSGLGLHWPRLDADLYVPALMQGIFGTKDQHSDHSGRHGRQTRGRTRGHADKQQAMNMGKGKGVAHMS